jgi:magnesium-transporting ATPase (P-type)
VRVAMITGDHAGTACAIARQVGLATALVVSGDELPEDDALLGALLDRDGVVACRVSPEQKQRIAKALQGRGHVVAMTGDGVNDGPALRQADIGIAMGRSGTDVARAAADLVLLDDRFETIVHAIEHGRATFANIRRFLTYHLTDNVAELTPFVLWALSGGRIPLALSVLQILCLKCRRWPSAPSRPQPTSCSNRPTAVTWWIPAYSRALFWCLDQSNRWWKWRHSCWC